MRNDKSRLRHKQQKERLKRCVLRGPVTSSDMGHCHTGARAHAWSLRMHANFAAVQTMAVLIFLPSSVSSKLDRQSHQLLWQTVAKNFGHIRFCRPNARWLSLLDDFVITNFGTRAPRAPAPWSKILATSLEATVLRRKAVYIDVKEQHRRKRARA